MLAFIFHTSKPSSYIAPFEAILVRIAKAHSLAYAKEFCDTATPYQYAFILESQAPSHNTQHAQQLDSAAAPHNAKRSAISPTTNSTKKSRNTAKSQEDFPTRVLSFANELSRCLPLSIYLVFDRIETEYVSKGSRPPRFYHNARKCAKPLASVGDILALMQSFEKQDSRFPRLCRQFFSHIRAKSPRHTLDPVAPAALFACLDSLARTLLESPITIATTRGSYDLSTKPLESSLDSSSLMFWEMGALQSFMRIDSAQLSCLASVEKPSMKLCPKDIFRDELLDSPAHAGRVEIECLLAFDPMLMLLGSLARSKGVEYVFIHKSKSLPSLTYTSPYFVPKLDSITCGRDGIYLSNRKSKRDLFSIIARHYPSTSLENSTPQPSTPAISQLNAHLMLVCYLSMKHASAIWIYDGAKYKQALPVSFASSETYMLETLAREYKGADRLLANYQAHFGEFCPNPLESIHLDSTRLDSAPLESTSLDGTLIQATHADSSSTTSAKSPSLPEPDSPYSHNLTDIFALIARTLQFCPSDASNDRAKASLLHYAKLCLRDKGPRIDYKLKKSPQGGLELDYPRILRSCMSFALAGVEREMIAFGVLDSLAEFMGNFVRDMAQNYAIKQVFVCGDMLSHKVFFDKALLYLPREIALILPQDGYIDTI